MKSKAILLLTLHDPLHAPPLEAIISSIFNVKCFNVLIGLELENNTLTLQSMDVEKQVNKVVSKYNVDAVITLDGIIEKYTSIFKKLCCKTIVVEYNSFDLAKITKHVEVLRSLGYNSIVIVALVQRIETIHRNKIELPVKALTLISVEKDHVIVSVTSNKQLVTKLKFECKTEHSKDIVKAMSALVTIGLLFGSLEETLSKGIEFLVDIIRYGLTRNALLYFNVLIERLNVLDNIYEALEVIEKNSSIIGRYIPEVQSNLVMSLPVQYVKGIDDIAGIKGRIIRYGNEARPIGPVLFGASKYMASLLRTVINMYPNIRSAMNIRYSTVIIDKARELGYVVVECGIRHDCREVSRVEVLNASLNECLQNINVEPDIIFHRGYWGIEPQVIVLGRDALDVVKKTLKLLRLIEEE